MILRILTSLYILNVYFIENPGMMRLEVGQSSCALLELSSWNYFSDILATRKSQMYFAPSTFTLKKKKSVVRKKFNLYTLNYFKLYSFE